VVVNLANGEKYKGEYKNGKRNGKGVFKFVDGSEYDGEWKDGIINGKGVYKYASGDEYNGEWKDKERNGKGIITFADGSKIIGEFQNNLVVEGKYKCYDRKGKSISLEKLQKEHERINDKNADK
jgi:hypothetical protein